MADIQYINYGDLQVDLLALLNKMADLVTAYVSKQPWSRKRKEKFMSAYSDMLTRGIVGADSNTGQWVVTVNGDDLNVDNLPKKDKLMYQEAAYFIKNLMASLAQAKPEEKKEEKTPYGNFREGFLKHVSNNIFGGNPVETEKWNNFDERNLFGIRDTKNRTEILSKLLLSYSNSITDDKFNFEGSPYQNATELKGKILNAINALGTESKQDDLESFYALGLDPDEWFNNGSGDASGHFRKNGTQFTNGEYYQYLKDKVKKVKQVKLSDEKLKQYKSLLSSIDETNATLLRFGSTEPSITIGQKGGLDTADYVDIGALIGDIASIVDPEPISAAAVGTTSALARIGTSISRGNFNLGESLLDIGTGLVGAIPWLGDAVMVGKVGKGIRAFVKNAGLVEAFMNYPGLSAVYNKITDGKFDDITADEWKSMLQFFRGVAANRVVARSNRALAETARASGLDVKFNRKQRFLGTGPTVRAGTTKYKVKAKVKNEAGEQDIEVPLDLKEYDDLVKDLRSWKSVKKGNNLKLIKEKIINKEEVKGVNPNAKVEDITSITYSPTWRRFIPFYGARSIRSNFNPEPVKFGGNTAELFETALQNRNFWDKIKTGSNTRLRNYREKFFGLETNRSVTNGVNPGQSPILQNSSANTGGTLSGVSSNITKLTQDLYKELLSTLRGTNYSGNPVVEGAGAVKGIGDIYVIKDPSGKDLFQLQIRGKDGKTYQTSYVEPSKFKEEALKTTKEVMRANISKETNKDLRHKINLDLILELKRVGALKQGGRIDKLKIQKYKEYIKI